MDTLNLIDPLAEKYQTTQAFAFYTLEKRKYERILQLADHPIQCQHALLYAKGLQIHGLSVYTWSQNMLLKSNVYIQLPPAARRALQDQC